VTTQSNTVFGLLVRYEPTIERVATPEETIMGRENFADKRAPNTSRTRPMRGRKAYYISSRTLPSLLLLSRAPMRKNSRGVNRAKPTSNTPAESRMVPIFFIPLPAFFQHV